MTNQKLTNAVESVQTRCNELFNYSLNFSSNAEFFDILNSFSYSTLLQRYSLVKDYEDPVSTVLQGPLLALPSQADTDKIGILKDS